MTHIFGFFVLTTLFVRIIYFHNWDDAENISKYYIQNLDSSNSSQFVLVYGPFHYSVLWILHNILESMIIPRITLVLMLLYLFNQYFKNPKYFYVFASIPGVQHFIVSYRPDTIGLILTLCFLINERTKGNKAFSITCFIGILLVKPNLIIFPLVIYFFAHGKIKLKTVFTSLVLTFSLYVFIDYYSQLPVIYSMFFHNINKISFSSFTHVLFSQNAIFSIIILLLVVKKINLTFWICLVISSFMALKVGSNLNYFLFFFFVAIHKINSINPIKMASIGILSLISLYSHSKYVQNYNQVSTTFANQNYLHVPSFMLSDTSITVTHPDAHMWTYANPILPDSGLIVVKVNSATHLAILDQIQPIVTQNCFGYQQLYWNRRLLNNY